MMEEKRKAALAKKLSQQVPTPSVSVPTELRVANNTQNFYNPSPFSTGTPKVVKGSCSLISKSSFEVQVGFHDQLIQTFKSIESGQYNAQKKTWNFNILDHDRLIQQIKPLQSEVNICPLPHWTLQTFKTARTVLPENT